MGFFSGETVVSVATSVSRVIEDNLIPNSCKTGMIQGLVAGEQLVENILESASSSIGVRAERMYRYGKNGYMFGLPNSTILVSSTGKAKVKEVIEKLVGHPVNIDYSEYGPLNNLHYGWLTLTDFHGYNQYTNELSSLSAAKGYPVYLTDLQVVVANATLIEIEQGYLDQWGTPATAGYSPLRPTQTYQTRNLRKPTPYAIDDAATADYFRVTYAWEDATGIKEDSFTFPMTLEDPTKDHFQAMYSYGTSVKFFTYMEGADAHPVLNGLFITPPSSYGSFFPFGYFRYKGHSAPTDPTSAEYKSSTKLMKYLGLDFAGVSTAINENPDIDDVESALLMMAVPADSNDPLECRYLFDFFSRLYTETGEVIPNVTEQAAALSGGLSPFRAKAAMVIQDSRFKMNLNFKAIYRRTKVGVIGSIDTYTRGYENKVFLIPGIKYSNLADTVGTPSMVEIMVPCHYYRRQVTKTIYEEVAVNGLKIVYYVEGSLAVSAMEGSPNLLIPLDHSITENYYAMDREKLYARSLHYVFNSKHETKLKWYQTQMFSFLMIAVAVVITVITWGADGGATLSAAITAATASAAAFAMAMLNLIIQFIIVKLAIKLFIKIFGVKFAIFVAVIAALYGMYSAYGSTQVVSANGMCTVTGAPWAKELLQVSSSLMSGVQEFYKDALVGIQSEASDFNVFAQEQTKLLEDTNKLLEGNNLLSPFVVFGEAPSDYYDRTVHSGNIGILGIDAISNFVDISLTLPKISETLGENFNDPAYV